MPWLEIQWLTRKPIAAIFSSTVPLGVGRLTQTPMRSGRVSPITLNSASASITQDFEPSYERPDTHSPRLEVEHHVDDPLAGAVIGKPTSTARVIHRKPCGIDEVGILRPGSGGVDGRVLQEPDELARTSFADGRRPALHRVEGERVVDQALADRPFNGRAGPRHRFNG